MKLISEEVASAEYLIEEKNGKKRIQNQRCILTIKYQK